MKKILTAVCLLCFGQAMAQQTQPAQQTPNAQRAQTEKPYKAYLVSDAHFDSQWNWDVQRSITDYISKTLDQNLFLLGKYPNYVFNFEGGIKYQWMKEYYPHQWELIKKYVDQGRWHVTGATWDATDPNIPSAESFTRNILYGQHFFRDELGVESTDIFLPDCFGFGWTLPTVAAHSGLIGFSTQKLMWRTRPFYENGSKIPFEIGLWQGIDGSRIMAIMDAHNYTTRWRYEDLSNSRQLLDIVEKSPLKTVYHYYGTGDTGGAPTIESVRSLEAGVAGNGPVEIISATSDQLYKDYMPFDAHPELPVWNSELLMDVHATGCYTSQAAMKLFNRRNELLADAAERSAVAADWLGGVTYPRERLTEAWKRFIWHQFHDDLTGTSIPRAYEFSWNDELISLKQFAGVLTTSVGAVARAMDTNVKGTPVVVYNATGNDASDLVEATIASRGGAIAVYGPDGQKVASQTVANNNGVATIVFAATVPANGYAVYDLRGGSAPKPAVAPVATTNSIENSVYKLTLNSNGDIASIVDKRNGRELVESGKAVRLALFTKNESFNWPAWEILKRTVDATPVSITENVKISLTENGPLRASLRVERTHGESTFCQTISLNEGPNADRIDIANDIVWQSTDALLKAEFPLAISNATATYDLGVGSIERGVNTDTQYEVYAQQWADLTGNGNGVSIINDSKYGWDRPAENTLRLTLLHTPSTRGGYAYQNRQDFGHHTFAYSIVSHEGDYRQGQTVRKAELFNQPLKAFTTPKHKGTLGRSFSMARSENPAVAMRALKQAEKSNEYVVRFYETTGREAQQASVVFAGNVVSAVEINGVEDEIAPATVASGRLEFTIKPFGMKTFRVKLAVPSSKVAYSVAAIAQKTVELPFNMKTASFNSFRSDANFDGKGNSYAAELLPRSLTVDGITFALGDPAAANGIKCRATEITLPAGNYNKLYLLAASTLNDRTATLSVDGQQRTAVIPYYSGFVGQWGHTGHTEGFIKPANVAWVGTHKHTMVQNRDVPYEFTYMFRVAVDIPAGAKKLILPDDPRVVVFAATVASESGAAIPASDLLRVSLPTKEADQTGSARVNMIYDRTVVERSGQVRRESAEMAIDEDPATKWCDLSAAKPKFIAVDMGSAKPIHSWYVMHAGIENLDYITKEYSLQVRNADNEEWRTVDTVTENRELETDRTLPSPVTARYVRLLVTKPDQSEGNVTRIYEFSVF
jgi:alpha-mannosidase